MGGGYEPGDVVVCNTTCEDSLRRHMLWLPNTNHHNLLVCQWTTNQLARERDQKIHQENLESNCALPVSADCLRP